MKKKKNGKNNKNTKSTLILFQKTMYKRKWLGVKFLSIYRYVYIYIRYI
jgi:hypothetical protein